MPIRQSSTIVRTRLGGTLDVDLTKYDSADWAAINSKVFGGSGTGFSLMLSIDVAALGAAISNPATDLTAEIFRFPLNGTHASEPGPNPSKPPPLLIETCSIFVSTPLVFPVNIAGDAPNSIMAISASLGKLVGPTPTPDGNAQLCKMFIGTPYPRTFQLGPPIGSFHFGDRSLLPFNPKTAAVNETTNVTTGQDRGSAGVTNALPAFVAFPDENGNTSLIFEISGFTNGGVGGPYVASSGIVNVYLTGKVLPSY